MAEATTTRVTSSSFNDKVEACKTVSASLAVLFFILAVIGGILNIPLLIVPFGIIVLGALVLLGLVVLLIAISALVILTYFAYCLITCQPGKFVAWIAKTNGSGSSSTLLPSRAPAATSGSAQSDGASSAPGNGNLPPPPPYSAVSIGADAGKI